MEDYSDKTLRALIRHLIAEDKVTDAIRPKENPDDRALITTQALLALRSMFSVKGFAALTVMGLIFEPEFTTTLIGFGLDQFEDFGKALEAFNKNPDDPFFLRLSEASAFMKDKTRQNKYKFLKDMQDLSEDNILPAEWFDKAATSSREYKPTGREIREGDVTPSDIAIYKAISEEDFSKVFTSNMFEIDSETGAVLIVGFDHKADYDSAKDKYDKLIEKAQGKNTPGNIGEGRFIDAMIIQAIKETHYYMSLGDEPNKAKERAGNARMIYDLSIEIESGSADDVDKKILFNSLSDLEGGIANSFDKAIRSSKEFVNDVIQKKIDEAADSIADKVGKKLEDLF